MIGFALQKKCCLAVLKLLEVLSIWGRYLVTLPAKHLFINAHTKTLIDYKVNMAATVLLAVNIQQVSLWICACGYGCIVGQCEEQLA